MRALAMILLVAGLAIAMVAVPDGWIRLLFWWL